jgi:N-acetyl-anhydromuramyl-L-alanine amidase AmpD
MQFIQAANHWIGREGQTPKYIILHGTAGFTNANDVAQYFARPDTEASAHYVVGQDGTVIKCVQEQDAAWSNGPVSGPSGISGDGVHHDSFWDTGINPNLLTIAIEHVKPHTDNSDTLTPAQKLASFNLVADICGRQKIPARAADASGGITGHFSMDPVNRSRCPGPYPFDELYQFLKEHFMSLPAGWHDNGKTIAIPGCTFVFTGWAREYVLAHNFTDIPVENVVSNLPQLELSNQKLEGGDRQRCRTRTLERTKDGHVFEAWTGPELLLYETLLKKSVLEMQEYQKTIQVLKDQVTQLQATPKTIIQMPNQTQKDISSLATSLQALVKQAQ